jgi:hypothetical protein
MRYTQVSIALALVIAMNTAAGAAVVYDAGVPQRPISVTGLSTSTGNYTASITYNIFIGDTLFDNVAGTGSSTTALQSALLSQLNFTGIDSATTILVLAVTDTAPFGDPSRWTGSVVQDSSAGAMNWTSNVITETDGMSNIFGIVSFTAVSLASSGGPAAGVPEPSTLAGCLVMAIAAGVRRRRQRRKLQLETADQTL